jgi:hypothetical protein
MEAACTSENSVYCNETTWRYIPESCRLHICRRKNMQSQILIHWLIGWLISIGWDYVSELLSLTDIVHPPDDRWVWRTTVEWYIDEGKQKNSEKNLSQSHFVHHKSHRDWPGSEPGTPRGEPGDKFVFILLNLLSEWMSYKCFSDSAQKLFEKKSEEGSEVLRALHDTSSWLMQVAYANGWYEHWETDSTKPLGLILENTTVFSVVAPCDLVEVDRRFRGACYLHHQGDLRKGVKVRSEWN